MLEKNMRINVLVRLSDAKARIAIWTSEEENLFDGYVYQLYGKTDFNNMYITYLNFDVISGITVIATSEWQK